MEEIWKPVVGYENRYEVSNLGNVRSIPQIIYRKNGAICYIKAKIKTIYRNNKNGYSTVCLVFNDVSSNKLLHRVVAQAFIPNPENKNTVNHINGIKSDNRVDNLEWATSSENNIHAYEIGIKKKCNGSYRIYKDDILRMYLVGKTKAQISTELGIPYISVWRAILKAKK